MAGTGNPVVVGSYQSVCSSPPPIVRNYHVAVCLDPAALRLWADSTFAGASLSPSLCDVETPL